MQAALEAQGMGPDSHLMRQFRDLTFEFRGNAAAIALWLKQPVPFPYFHMLHMLLVGDLFAISCISCRFRTGGLTC